MHTYYAAGPRRTNIILNTTPTKAKLAILLGNCSSKLIYYQELPLNTSLTFLERGVDGAEQHVTLVVTHAPPPLAGSYFPSIDVDGIFEGVLTTNRPEVSRFLKRLGCPETLPKIRVVKETTETTNEDEDEDNTAMTVKKRATRTSWTWVSPSKNGVVTTVVVTAQAQGVLLNVQVDYREARDALLADIREVIADSQCGSAEGILSGTMSFA